MNLLPTEIKKREVTVLEGTGWKLQMDNNYQKN